MVELPRPPVLDHGRVNVIEELVTHRYRGDNAGAHPGPAQGRLDITETGEI
jgi:hypothetical protein